MSNLKRFSPNEFSLARLASALRRRLVNIPHALAWRIPSKLSQANRQVLLSLRNIHLSERCFIIGNGPSLAGMELSKLKHEICFGMNRIYLNFDSMGFLPTYYVAINPLVLNQYYQEISSLPVPRFINWASRSKYSDNSFNRYFLNVRIGLFDSFQTDLSKPVSSGGTVTFVALQIAFFMGFKEVILIGVDHNFTETGTPNLIVTRPNTGDTSHFHPNYFPPGSKWQLPDLRRSELAYRLAKQAFEKNDRRILDATVGGKLEVFPKVDYESI